MWFKSTTIMFITSLESHLSKEPGSLLGVKDAFTFDELRETADLIIHQTACLLSCAAQGTQV